MLDRVITSNIVLEIPTTNNNNNNNNKNNNKKNNNNNKKKTIVCFLASEKHLRGLFLLWRTA